jgi:hypothetical protein
MNKKLLLTSALVSSVVAGSALAEIKVGGDIEVTMRSYSTDAKAVSDGSHLGQETNVTVSGGKDLDNGMTLKLGVKLEGDAGVEANERSFYAESDTMFIGYGRDHGAGIDLDGSVAPHVGDQNDTLGIQAMAFSSNPIDGVYAGDHLKLGFKSLGGTFSALYAPSLGSNNNDAGALTTGGGDGGDASASGYAIGYQGNLGIDGLSVQAGIVGSDEVATTSTGEQELTKIGVAYNFGQFAVGGDVMDYGNGRTDGTSGVMGTQSKRVNATFAASDNMALGVSYTETEESLGNTATGYLTQTKEEMTALTVGYNIAGLGFNFSYAEIENVGGASGTDATTWQIQTKQAF